MWVDFQINIYWVIPWSTQYIMGLFYLIGSNQSYTEFWAISYHIQSFIYAMNRSDRKCNINIIIGCLGISTSIFLMVRSVRCIRITLQDGRSTDIALIWNMCCYRYTHERCIKVNVIEISKVMVFDFSLFGWFW